jgi:hypothetical protein
MLVYNSRFTSEDLMQRSIYDDARLSLEQILGGVCDVVVGEAGDEVVAVIVARLLSQGDFMVWLIRCFDEVFGQQLALLVEVVLGALVG